MVTLYKKLSTEWNNTFPVSKTRPSRRWLDVGKRLTCKLDWRYFEDVKTTLTLQTLIQRERKQRWLSVYKTLILGHDTKVQHWNVVSALGRCFIIPFNGCHFQYFLWLTLDGITCDCGIVTTRAYFYSQLVQHCYLDNEILLPRVRTEVAYSGFFGSATNFHCLNSSDREVVSNIHMTVYDVSVKSS